MVKTSPFSTENGVDLNCLGILSEERIKELVPPVGPRARLKSNNEQWKTLLPGYNPQRPDVRLPSNEVYYYLHYFSNHAKSSFPTFHE